MSVTVSSFSFFPSFLLSFFLSFLPSFFSVVKLVTHLKSAQRSTLDGDLIPTEADVEHARNEEADEKEEKEEGERERTQDQERY